MNEKDLAHYERLALEKPTESIIDNLNDALTDAVNDVETALKLMAKDRAAMLGIVIRLARYADPSFTDMAKLPMEQLRLLVTDAQRVHLQILGKAAR